MKQTIKILFFVSIGLLIGYFIADFNLEIEAEISNPEKAETIVELMGTETTFGVKGNCKMCKKTIETAALSLDGVHKAVWDVETKQIDLVYDDQFVELMTIHNTIAASGYSTELVDLNQEAYDNLPLCCQYDPEK
ncbi:MAG: heavy-metal-associated domain-containing protein [Flavobacteriaceae bacterium]|nr:heavy-metal-associated domain-containing protein [Flavobacteriaceae bacterium]